MVVFEQRGGAGLLQVFADGSLRFAPADGSPALRSMAYGIQEHTDPENHLCWQRGGRLIGEQYSSAFIARSCDDGRLRMEQIAEDGSRPGGFWATFAVDERGFSLSIDAIDASLPMLSYPPPIISESLVLPLHTGLWQRQSLPRFERQLHRFCGHDLRMRFHGGYVDEASERAWIAIVDRGWEDAGLLRAGAGAAPVWLRSRGVWQGARRLCYRACADGYNGIAQAFRSWCAQEGLLVTLAEKCASRPQLARIIGRRKLSFLCAQGDWQEHLERQWLPVPPGATPEAAGPHIHSTFAQARAMIAEARCLGWQGLAQIVGWNHGGWDTVFPHAWPPEPGCGDAQHFAALFDQDDEVLVGILDNYADTYRRLSDFPAGVLHRPDGTLQEGGIWSGGQCHLLDYRQVLPAARKNLAHYRACGVQGIYLDTTTAVQLCENHDPQHLGSRSDDAAARLALLAIFRAAGMVIGSEVGCDFGMPVLDWSPGGIKQQTAGMTIPLWSLVFHDCHIQYHGFLSIAPRSCPDSTPDLLARAHRACLPGLLYGYPPDHVRITADNWSVHRALIEALAWVDAWHQRIGSARMCAHRCLAPGVERSEWSTGEAVIINTSEQPYTADGITIPAQDHGLVS